MAVAEDAIIEGLIIEAIEGALKLNDFYERWPKTVTGPAYEQIYHDIEDAIEHTPGYFLKKGVDLAAWLKQQERTNLVIDIALMKKCDPSNSEWTRLLNKAHLLINLKPKMADDEMRTLVSNLDMDSQE